ncbi:zinc dependent phospholipase C family protein [Christensenella intestinihominis]|uniref:zinc dependent phospholipase C family protein n=1 Tax=Christensenella intestinihominis TaxID=1851429 RepID=UPI00083258BA|nr:zinc dependent phospholipase C family protein [Christensenella intestinihominis]
MPTTLTHKIAADNILEKLTDARAKKIITENLSAYYSGSQGGDIFLLYKFYFFLCGAKMKMLGWALHYTRPQRFFCEGAEYVKKQGSDTLKSYFYGYITHYCLDMFLHPHINAETKPMSTHNTLECALDILYAKKNGVDAYAFDKEQFARDTIVPGREIDTFYREMSYLFPGLKVDEQPYTKAARYYAYYNGLVSQPTRADLRKLGLLNVISQLKLKTMLYQPIETYAGLYDYDFYFGLLERAVTWAVRRIGLVQAFFEDRVDITQLESEFYNVSFHGKAIVPQEERKPFKRMYKKAPLVHVKEPPKKETGLRDAKCKT